MLAGAHLCVVWSVNVLISNYLGHCYTVVDIPACLYLPILDTLQWAVSMLRLPGNVHYYAAAHILTTDPRLLVLSSQSKFSVSSDLSSVLRYTYGAVSRCTIYERCLPGKELAGALRTQQDLCSRQTIGGSRGTAPYNHNIGHTREGSLKEKKIHIHTLKVPVKRRRVIYQLRIQLKVGIRTGVFIFIDGRK